MVDATEENAITLPANEAARTMRTMRFIMLLVITLAVGAGFLYVYTNAQKDTQAEIQEQQNAAQEATDAYRKNQEEMMRQMQ